jgi:hypothetical protein
MSSSRTTVTRVQPRAGHWLRVAFGDGAVQRSISRGCYRSAAYCSFCLKRNFGLQDVAVVAAVRLPPGTARSSADAIDAHIAPLRDRYRRLFMDPGQLDARL